MYSKGKQQQMQQQPQQMVPPPPPPQQSAEFASKDKLAQFVYEYLVHMGAKNSAQTFLTEIRWNEKPIGVGDAPGFLTSWWSVFWDLYCAATPGMREQFEPSNEAKAFHEYTNGMLTQQQAPPPPPPPPPLGPPPPDPSQMQQPNPNQMMTQPNQFFAAPNPQNTMINSGQPQFQRFHSGGAQRSMRMPSNMEFNPNNPNQMNPESVNLSRVPAGMSPLSRLTPPGNRMPPPGMQQAPPPPPPQQQPPPGVPQMTAFNGAGGGGGGGGGGPPQQRGGGGPPQPQQQPPPPQQQQPPPPPPNQTPTPGTPMSPSMVSFQQQQQRWNAAHAAAQQQQQQHQQQQQNMQQAQQHNMNFTSASPPITFANVQMSGHPGTPGIISSPQDANGDINFNNIMKNVPGGMQFHEQNMAHMVSINPEVAHHTHLNNEMIDSMKHSPMQGGVRHQDDHSGAGSMNDLNSYNHFGDGSVNLF